MPTSSEARPPQISRLRMSRPCSSVPSRWPGVPGGESRSAPAEVSGSHGLMSGAASAAPAVITMIAKPSTACRSRKKMRTNEARALGPGRGADSMVLTASAVAMRSGRSRARVEVEVHHVHHQVHDHERQRDEERGTLDDLHVACDHRGDELLAEH